MSQVLTAKDSIIARVPPTYQYSVLNGWGTNEQDDEEADSDGVPRHGGRSGGIRHGRLV